MRTENNLYGRIADFENLHNAYCKARKNKRMKSDVIRYGCNLEENLIELHNHLQYCSYTPSRYNEFYIYDPKVRLILALPFKDRVVHQAICSIIEPIFEHSFISDSYACRKGKGTIAGLKRVSYFINKLRENGKNIYCLKMDIRKYFCSIDHGILKRAIRKKIRCKKTLDLLDTIIDSVPDPGLPVGNLTSQLFANIFLDQADHFIKEVLRVKYYVRYMDDMLIIHEDKSQLHIWQRYISEFLADIKLELNNKTSIFPAKNGIDFLGYRQYAGHRILRKRVLKNNLRKFRSFSNKKASEKKITDSLKSFQGLLSYCNCYKITEKLKIIVGVELWEHITSGRMRTAHIQ